MPEYQLQQDGCEDRAAHHGDDDRCHQGPGQHSQLQAPVGYDQRHLAAADHAHAHLQALLASEMTELCAQAAADDLGGHRNQQQENGEQHQAAGHAVHLRLDAHAGEEHRRQQQEAQRLELGLDIGGLGGAGDHQARHIGAGDVRHAEELLRAVSHQKAQHKGQHRIAAPLPAGPQGHQPAEELVGEEGDHSGEHEEQHDLQQHQGDAVLSAGQATDDGQGNQAQHVVDQSRRQNGVAHLGIQLADLLQCLHCDADGSCSKDGADEHILQKSAGLNHAGPVCEHRQTCAQHQWDDHAQQGHQEARLAAVLQLLDIGAHAGGEHQYDHAQLAELGEELRF